MENNFPCPIKEEKDLSFYEDYIKEQNQSSCQIIDKSVGCTMDYTNRQADSPIYMPAYLSGMKGKLIRVESLIGDRLEARTGILLKVGADFLVIKLFKGSSTMIIKWSTVKYITVVHSNDLSKMNLL